MRPLLRGAIASALIMLVLAPAAVANSPSHTTFANVVAGSKLIVLAKVEHRSDGAYTFHVERVLKGTAPAELVYPPLLETPPLGTWSRVVIAFAHPENDDFRAPTIAWHVARDGSIDPEGFQRYPGLPMTLAAMLRYFELPATDTAPVVVLGSTGMHDATPGVLIAAALVGLWLGSRPYQQRARR